MFPRWCTLEELFNKPGHGLGPRDLVDSLVALLDSGLIEISVDQRPWTPAADQIAAALETESRPDIHAPFYGLTAQGGACWEAFAAPDWNRFILEDFDEDTHTGTVICADVRKLETYLRYLELRIREPIIDRRTVAIKEIGEWQATYWKQLPQGYSARIPWTPNLANHEPLNHLAFSGLCRFRDDWYRWR